jgi:hypothetical protein
MLIYRFLENSLQSVVAQRALFFWAHPLIIWHTHTHILNSHSLIHDPLHHNHDRGKLSSVIIHPLRVPYHFWIGIVVPGRKPRKRGSKKATAVRKRRLAFATGRGQSQPGSKIEKSDGHPEFGFSHHLDEPELLDHGQEVFLDCSCGSSTNQN